MPPATIAEVALPRTIGHATSAVFSYRVPPHLRAHIQAGQLVWVPLKQQQVQGIVLELHTRTDSGYPSLRDIADHADPHAIITPTGLRLAQWIATTCLAPLYDVLALFLPPGVTQHADITWRATTEGHAAEIGALPEDERAILYYLRTHGETSAPELGRALRGGEAKLREACTLLRERGLVERGTSRSTPRVRPRTERTAQLIPAPGDVAAALESLSRSQKQQAVVRWLDEQSGAERPALPVGDIYAATGTTLPVLQALEKKGLLLLDSREVRRDPLAAAASHPTPPGMRDEPPPLTPGQRRVWQPISAALDALREEGQGPAAPHTFLLHGVTGSGKTEIYLRAVARTLRLGRAALILVPEIALTAQLVRRFAARFPGQVAVLHSELSAGERYDEWRRVQRGDARVVIGSRSAVFAPLEGVGLIIMDEEHEPGYKHDNSPRYHVRAVVGHLAALSGSVVLLGSATPSVESYYAALHGQATLLEMMERVGRAAAGGGAVTQTLPLPHVRLVDMRYELQLANRSIFSHPLQTALTGVLERGEQAILFLNRRGAATFVMCRDCGHVLSCPACGVPLVMHYEGDGTPHPDDPTRPTLLLCHSCNHHEGMPVCCPECFSKRIKSFGVGTQRVEQEVIRLFPQARPLRWDRDSVRGKGAHDRMLNQFLRRDADVLIGTQMIAKGLDLPHVSLVGVVAADTALYLPDFRSGERTFQLLTQVAGRAGRRQEGAEVIIQTYTPHHYALQAAQEHDYRAFYTEEIAFRRQVIYPPFGRLVRFVYSSTSYSAAERAATELDAALRAVIKQMGLYNWGIIGPAPAFFRRQRGHWRWHLLLRLSDERAMRREVLADLVAQVAQTMNLHGWAIDVEPVHVL
jgi:primosomal protein N' (replication factor Y) (superfamily II helicase)